MLTAAALTALPCQPEFKPRELGMGEREGQQMKKNEEKRRGFYI